MGAMGCGGRHRGQERNVGRAMRSLRRKKKELLHERYLYVTKEDAQM
jgi:hypothetical protein